MKTPINEIEFIYTKSSGPGGQNVNKLNTKVTLLWEIDKSKGVSQTIRNRFIEKFAHKIKSGVVQITSQRFRNQGRNTADCVNKLEQLLEQVWQPPKKRKPTKPKKSAINERIKQKKQRGDLKKSRSQKW